MSSVDEEIAFLKAGNQAIQEENEKLRRDIKELQFLVNALRIGEKHARCASCLLPNYNRHHVCNRCAYDQ